MRVSAARTSLIILSLLLIGSIVFFIISFNDSAPLDRGKTEKKTETEKLQAIPADREFYETAFKFAEQTNRALDGNVVGGIIPHHLLAADLIADFFSRFGNIDYDTVVLIGPNHFSLGQEAIITSALDWETPYGVLENDTELLEKLAAIFAIENNSEAISQEHSITSEAAFIKRSFPRAKFLPLIVKPGLGVAEARYLGEKIFNLSREKNILFLASVDFSHYKDSRTAQQDDLKSLAAINNFKFEEVADLALDSPPAISALMAFAEKCKAEFELLKNSNSALLLNQPEIENTTSYVTGLYIVR